MKKLLGMVLVLALVAVTVPAKADVLKNIKSKGEIQVLGTWDDNMSQFTASPESKYAQTSVRVLYGISAGLTQDVKANLTFIYYNMWGNEGEEAGKSLNNYFDEVNIIEGNVQLFNLFCALDAKIGRQFYGDEDSAVIYFGPNHYNSEQRDARQATAIDAVNFSHVGEVISWNFIYGKVVELEGDPGIPNSDFRRDDVDTSLIGFDIKAKISDAFQLQAYIYDIREKYLLDIDPAIAGEYVDDDHTGFWGVKPSFTTDAFAISAEYARNFDGDRFAYDVNRDMVKVDGALFLGDFTPRAQYYRNNGDDLNGFTSLGNYRPGLIHGQFNDGLALFNKTIWNIGLDMNFENSDKLTYSIDLYGFQPVDHLKDWDSYEGDVWVKYAHNDNVELHAAVGTVKFPGDDHLAFKAQSGMLVRF